MRVAVNAHATITLDATETFELTTRPQGTQSKQYRFVVRELSYNGGNSVDVRGPAIKADGTMSVLDRHDWMFLGVLFDKVPHIKKIIEDLGAAIEMVDELATKKANRIVSEHTPDV